MTLHEPTFGEMLDVIVELLGGEPPCNFNDIHAKFDDWCDEHCGDVSAKECWKHAVMPGGWRKDDV